MSSLKKRTRAKNRIDEMRGIKNSARERIPSKTYCKINKSNKSTLIQLPILDTKSVHMHVFALFFSFSFIALVEKKFCCFHFSSVYFLLRFFVSISFKQFDSLVVCVRVLIYSDIEVLFFWLELFVVAVVIWNCSICCCFCFYYYYYFSTQRDACVWNVMLS